MNPQQLFNEAANLMNRLQTELIWAYGANARASKLIAAINGLERRIARRKGAAIVHVVNTATRETRIQRLGEWYGMSL